MIEYRLNYLYEDLELIKSLQEKNLKSALTEQLIKEQGFVTAVYSVEDLGSMSGTFKHSLAFDGAILAGYVLCMVPEEVKKHPFLLDVLRKTEVNIAEHSSFRLDKSLIIGQVCVASSYRRRGILQELYRRMAIQVGGHYHHLVTLVDRANQPSVVAHKAFGFKEIDLYKEPLGREWVIVAFEL